MFLDFGSLHQKPRVPYIAMPFVVGPCTRWLVPYFQTGATLPRHFLRAVAAAVIFVRVVAATPWLNVTTQASLCSEMFLQLGVAASRFTCPPAVAAAASRFSLTLRRP